MYKIAKPLFIHCITPMHAGSGNDLGIVDLPIQRESHTGYPKIEASGLKGSIRESFEEKADNDDDHIKIHLAFGYDSDSINSQTVKTAFIDPKSQDYAGALGFSDARLLLFPLKSMRGTFVWATCPQALERLSKELTNLCEMPDEIKFDFVLGEGNVIAADPAPLSINASKTKIQLEEYCFDVLGDKTADAKALAETLSTLTGITNLTKNLVILPNDVFTDFAKIATEVVTRIKIDNVKGTAKGGALFTEEYLPAESVLYSLVLASPVFGNVQKELLDTYTGIDQPNKVLSYFKTTLELKNSVLQIGGNATLGKGIVQTKFHY